jgi:hypothetical protein
MRRLAYFANRALAHVGVEIRKIPPQGSQQAAHRTFLENALAVSQAHEEQTLESIRVLGRKYETPVLGSVEPWQLLERLAECIDPTDIGLGCASQQVHTLQVLESMEMDGIEDEGLFIAALLHDIGKILLLTGENPENVVCLNNPVGKYLTGVGFDNCVFQWNHDEFAYTRLKDEVPDHVAWLIRYHSINMKDCQPLMDERDRRYAELYLRPFQKHDQGSKSPYRLPVRSLSYYRARFEAIIPQRILF